MSDATGGRSGLGRPGPAAHERGPYTVGIEEEVMLLDQRTWALAHRIDSVLPRLPPDAQTSGFTAETHGSALEIQTGVARHDRRRDRRAGGRCAGARRDARGRSRPAGRGAPAPTRSRSGRRPSSPPASATSSSTARCASWPDASRPSACTCTSACPTPRRRSTPTTGCAPTSRCCWRSRSTRPSGRAATPASPPPARRCSRPFRGSASRAPSPTTPTTSRRSTC